MSIERYDFNDFNQSDYFISYNNLFASEAPELKGKMVCRELVEMDDFEYQTIKAEEYGLKGTLQKVNRIYQAEVETQDKYFSYSLAGFIGGAIAFHLHDTLKIAGVVATIFSAIGFVVGGSREAPTKKLDATNVLNDHRLQRLVNKVRTLEKLISETTDPARKQELNLAKHYFENNYRLSILKFTNLEESVYKALPAL